MFSLLYRDPLMMGFGEIEIGGREADGLQLEDKPHQWIPNDDSEKNDGLRQYDEPRHIVAIVEIQYLKINNVTVVAEWSRYQVVAGLVTSSSPLPLKIRHVRQRCTLNLWRSETSYLLEEEGASSGVVHVT
ncbi:hypothetical protein TNCV_2987401 [Trichonephila clavipes]|nr:hypothetical protein TNCV_2987401 [Trichonephila clavipes]